MPNEADKQELSESTLRQWLIEAYDKHTPPAYRTQGITANRLAQAIETIRATQQELAECRSHNNEWISSLKRIAELEQQLVSRPYYLCDAPDCKVCDQARRINELEQQLSQTKTEIGARDLVINSARMGEERNRERIEELESLLQFGHEYIHAHSTINQVSAVTISWLDQARAALAKKEEKDV